MITIIKGTDVKLAITLQYKDDCELTPVDLTDRVVSIVYKDLTATRTKTTPTAVQVVDLAYGKLILNLSDIDTERLRIGPFDFDVVVEFGEEKLIWKFVNEAKVQDRVR